MSDWEVILGKLVRLGERLPENLREAFSAEPPSTGALPPGLPAVSPLGEFYAICDGGSIGLSHFFGREELEDLREWSGDEYPTGRYWIFGDTEFGHPLVWDSTEDRVGYHDLDGADGLVMSNETGAEMMGLPLNDFFESIFSRPVAVREDIEKLWAETLDQLERLS